MAIVSSSLSMLLHDQVRNFEEHSKRVGSVIDDARKRFNQDYTGYVAGFSATVTVASFTLAFLKESPLVPIVGLIVGGTGIVSSLVSRHLNQRQEFKFTREVISLEEERSKASQRAATMSHIWLYGVPEGTSLAQVQVLLGDAPTLIGPADQQPTWKALPPPSDGEDD